jgi:hypothetical protein
MFFFLPGTYLKKNTCEACSVVMMVIWHALHQIIVWNVIMGIFSMVHRCVRSVVVLVGVEV